jgi:hypothetical protein
VRFWCGSGSLIHGSEFCRVFRCAISRRSLPGGCHAAHHQSFRHVIRTGTGIKQQGLRCVDISAATTTKKTKSMHCGKKISCLSGSTGIFLDSDLIQKLSDENSTIHHNIHTVYYTAYVCNYFCRIFFSTYSQILLLHFCTWSSNGFLKLVKIYLFSGIPLLEASGMKRWGKNPEYLRYVENTPVLIPFIKT